MLSVEIDMLRDDGFEGSINELFISREVFCRSHYADTGNGSSASGVVNVKSKQSRLVEMFHFPNGEKLVQKIQAYSKKISLKDDDTANCVSEKKFLSGDSNDQSVSVDMDDQAVAAKRLKLSVGQHSGLKPHLEDALPSSMANDFVSGVQQPILPADCSVMMFNVVESSDQGVITSCHMLKQGVGSKKEGDFRVNVPKGNLSGSNRSKGNTICVPFAIASPDSQESFAARTLMASPSVNAINECGSLLYAGGRPKGACEAAPSVEFEEDLLLIGNGAKDPRSILRHRTFRLLREAGWSIEKRKRQCRSYFEFVYRTPEGRSVREFPKAWDLCGKRLLVNGASQLLAEEEKEWSDINEFWSDLFDTLRTVDNRMKDWEPKAALALKWALLDPFATVVFIQKKILALKSGNVVKSRSSITGKSSKSVAIPVLKYVDNEDNGAFEIPTQTAYYDASLPAESSILDFDGSSQGGSLQVPISRSICVSKGNSMTLLETLNGSGSCNEEILTAGTRHCSVTGSQSCVSDITCLQATGCLYDIPIKIGNFDIVDRHSETFSSHQGSCSMSSPSCSKHNLEPIMKIGKDVGIHLLEEGAKSLRLTTGEMWVTSSAVDSPNHTDAELIKSSRLNKACVSSNINVGIYFPSCKEPLVENLQYIDKESGVMASAMYERQQMFPEAGISDVDQKFSTVLMKCIQDLDSQKSIGNATCCSENVDKKKMHKELKKVSEIECNTLCASERLIFSASHETEADVHDEICHVKLSQIEKGPGVHAEIGESCYNVSSSASWCKNEKKSRYWKFDNNGILGSDHSKEVTIGKIRVEAAMDSWRKKKSRKACQLNDDDLLISAIIQKKILRLSSNDSGTKASKVKAPKRSTSRKGPCRLLPRSIGKGGKHTADDRWSSLGERTVLFWLINMGAIFLNEIIQFRDSKGDTVVKDGFVTRDGILCKCCSQLLSVSKFKAHAGFNLSYPCLNLFMESDKPFTLCQLQAWSSEYKSKKSISQTVAIDESDQNDDSCGWCGEGGELLCCDSCPSTFHQSCLLEEELPEGSWYCPSCSCRSCGKLVDEKEASSSFAPFKCSQCEHKYHGACLGGKGLTRMGSNLWFCSEGCGEVYSGLHSHIAITNHIDNGFSWTLLRCVHDDQKIHSAQWFALKAECNSKLAVALTIMEECFVSMVDPRTGINMIPHVVFNWGSAFSRLNYHGFYTAVLEKNDVLISVASIRIHGTKVAEMPLIATCSKYRRQGMCRKLLSSVEKMLISFKVEKLVIAAIPSTVETWTAGFGFIPMKEDEKRSLNKTSLMVFPGTVMLKKSLYKNQDADFLNHATSAPLRREESAKEEACTGKLPMTDSVQEQCEPFCINVDDGGSKIEAVNCLVQKVDERQEICEGAAAEAGSNFFCQDSLADKNEDVGGTVSESKKDHFKCSNMEVDTDKEIDEASKCRNFRRGDLQAIESGDIQAVEPHDKASLQISEDGCTGQLNVVRESEPRLSDDKAIYLGRIENSKVGEAALYMNSQNGVDYSVDDLVDVLDAEVGIKLAGCRNLESVAGHGANSLPNPFSEQRSREASKHVLDSKASATTLESEKDEEREILEAFAAVKAAFSNNVGSPVLDGGGTAEASEI